MSDSSLRPHPSALSSELRVFISSTYHDLQEEREHLINKIFPKIRALCRERGVTFTEVDLRWAITEGASITEMEIVHGVLARTPRHEYRKRIDELVDSGGLR